MTSAEDLKDPPVAPPASKSTLANRQAVVSANTLGEPNAISNLYLKVHHAVLDRL
jgi:hypothetical protein